MTTNNFCYVERKDYYRTSILISNLLAAGVSPSDFDYVSILDIKYGEPHVVY